MSSSVIRLRLESEGMPVSATEFATDPPTDSEPPPSSECPRLPETVIEPRPGWHLLDVGELWRYRELLLLLTWRDVTVRYKQTALGVAWVILQPLAMMAAFSLFLAKVGGIAEKVEHYPLFVLAGLLAWGCFSTALSSAAASLVGNQNLITKVYFPRLIIPLSAAGVSVVDLAVGLGLLAVVMAIFGVGPGWSVLLVPVLVLLIGVAALGVGILLAALTVSYRDFRYVVPFMIQFWMFATPVIYMPVDLLGPTTQSLLPLNPAYGMVLNFRACVLGTPLDWYALSVSSAVALCGLAVGCLYFRRVERSFADVI
jgi:lipopolysaccharide transport system permease protein